MRSANGIQHIVRLIMSRTVQPKFSHRKVYFLVMQQAVTDHGRCYTFGRKLAIIFFGAIGQYLIENIHNKFRYRCADIM